MDEIRATASAYYAKLPQSQKQQALEIFNSMDRDRDGKVDLQEYIAQLKQLPTSASSNSKTKTIMAAWISMRETTSSTTRMLSSSITMCCSKEKGGNRQSHLRRRHPRVSHPNRKPIKLKEASQRRELSLNQMDEIRATVSAYYANLPQSRKQEAQKFFRSMDTDGDEKVDLQEYLAGLRKLGLTTLTDISFFKELDRDGNGSLDFDEVLTLFYLIETGRIVFCAGCGEFLKGVYFTCVNCFDNSTAESFDLCCSCYHKNNFQHHKRAVFVDNYLLLQSKRIQSAKRSRGKQAKKALKAMLNTVEAGLALFGFYQIFQ
ncbi:hypothetical protein DITRI_Ditri08aG0028900 [Diplodiscus trichospermus]